MPIWRCPHCGTPQAETSRCWVCRRSSTTCSTCRHFRRAVAGSGGFCGLDRKRLPLTGLELRGCWEEGPTRAHDAYPTVPVADDPMGPLAALGAPGPAPDAAVLRLREFVPVELRADRARARREALVERRRAEREAAMAEEAAAEAALVPTRLPPPEPAAAWPERGTLWGDLET